MLNQKQKMIPKILIIDDEPKLRELLAKILVLEGYEVQKAENASNGLALINQDLDLVITDVRLPDGNGIILTKQIKELAPLTEIIVLTAFGNIADGVMAMRNGAFDYLVKGENHVQMLASVPRAIEKAQQNKKNAENYLKNSLENIKNLFFDKNIQKIQEGFSTIIGESDVLKQSIKTAQKVAKTDASVLLIGETGTGKEVFAKAIYEESLRKNQSFVALNCANFPKDLLESELFGHKKGSFTGALSDKKGILEIANEGTLFLDELGEMNIDLQAKLLRVLDSKMYYKVGETQPKKVDFRLICATNRNLEEEIQKGNFRADLYYRIGVFSIILPPLRERKSDILPLSIYFLEDLCKKMGVKYPNIAENFFQTLQQHDFKGNVRELRNILERALILCENNTLNTTDLPQNLQKNLQDIQQKQEFSNFYFDFPEKNYQNTLADVEKSHILRVLEAHEHNKNKTAEHLGIGLTTLYRKLAEYQINEHF